MAPKLPPPANTKAVFAAEWSDTDKETVAPATRVGGTRGVLAEFIAGDWRGVPQPPSSSPRTRRAVRGKLSIAEADLVGGASVAGGRGGDLGGSVDIGDRPSYEQRCCDEAGKADGRHDDAAFACGDPQQQISDHGSDDLQADRVLGAAEELAKLQMLLDPAEQQFDLPAGFVKRGDLDRRAFQIVSDEGEFCAVIAPEADAAHRNRKPRIARADELHLGIVDDREALRFCFSEWSPARCPKARVCLLPGNGAGAGAPQPQPP